MHRSSWCYSGNGTRMRPHWILKNKSTKISLLKNCKPCWINNFFMKRFTVYIAASFFVITAFSQKQKFDIATFIPPKGWQRIDSNGVVLFQQSKTNNGRTSFCQIFLFPSQASSGDAAKDFTNEWDLRVVRATGTRERPQASIEKTQSGW